MTPHDLPCTRPHSHADDEDRRRCEAEHEALMQRLADPELAYA